MIFKGVWGDFIVEVYSGWMNGDEGTILFFAFIRSFGNDHG